jgi:hypothetical protein
MRGNGRAAALNNARQKTAERPAQDISNIIMGQNRAFVVPHATLHSTTVPDPVLCLNWTQHVLKRDSGIAPRGVYRLPQDELCRRGEIRGWVRSRIMLHPSYFTRR